jgi:hypothetical protein
MSTTVHDADCRRVQPDATNLTVCNCAVLRAQREKTP